VSNPDAGGGPASPEPRIVDARGMRCPLPIIELARAARTAAPGAELVVWWTDPAAEHDIPAWARMRGHRVLATTPLAVAPPADQAWATTVRLSP
jgi:TusA-related sulfurtransferase